MLVTLKSISSQDLAALVFPLLTDCLRVKKPWGSTTPGVQTTHPSPSATLPFTLPLSEQPILHPRNPGRLLSSHTDSFLFFRSQIFTECQHASETVLGTPGMEQ